MSHTARGPLFRFVCPKCGKEPPRDEARSNEHWNVIPAECPECKVQLKMELTGKERRNG